MAMEKHPEDRFASAEEFAAELRRWLADEPLRTRRPTLRERLRRWARRNRVAARVAAASVAVVATGGVLGGIAIHQRNLRKDAERDTQVREVKHLVERQAEARVAHEKEIMAAETKAQLQIRALIQAAQAGLAIPTQGRRLQTQETLRRIAGPRKQLVTDELRDRLDLETRSLYAATLAVPDLAVRDSLSLKVSDKKKPEFVFHAVWRVAMHPDGKSMGIGTPEGPTRWQMGQAPQLPRDLDPTKPRASLLYSPDGKYLAFAPDEGGVRVWDEAVSRVLADLDPHGPTPFLAMGFNRAGSELFACRADGELRHWSVPGFKAGPVTKLAAKGTARLTAAALNADTTRIAVGDERGVVRLLLVGGKLIREVRTGQSRVTALAWSPDDRLVVVGTQDGNVQLWQVEDGQPAGRFAASSVEITTIQFSPDGRWLLAGEREAMKMWDMATGAQVLTGDYPPWGFARDGRTFAGGRNTGVAFCRILVPEALRQLRGQSSIGARRAWSGDGHRLATIDSSYAVRVWDVERGVLLDEFAGPPGRFWPQNAAVALNRDGSQVGYVNGGVSDALIRDVNRHATLARWKLPAGFDRLAYADNRFLLAREELADNRGRLRSAAYSLVPGQAPKLLRVFRPGRPGDVLFFTGGLTPNGRFCWWDGPRLPPNQHRIEVYDLTTWKLVTRVPQPLERPVNDSSSWFSADGRYLWHMPEGKPLLRYDLAANKPPETVADVPIVSAAAWRAFDRGPDDDRPVHLLSLEDARQAKPWLELTNADLSPPGPIEFSPDGRYLAWGGQSGAITVADLPALRKEIGAFAKKALP
jgi:WD40 repeat protein